MSQQNSNTNEYENQVNEVMLDYQKNHKKYKIRLIALIAVVSLTTFGLYQIMPQISEEEKQIIFHLPDTSQKMKLWKEVAQKYTNENQALVIFVFLYAYAILIGFSIPGHQFLAIIIGSLWGMYFALPFVCFCSTVGATISYLLSQSLLKGLVIKCFGNKINSFVQKIQNNRQNLYYYFLFVRISPIFPNTMVNWASPIANIPLKVFTLGTFVGLIPINIINLEIGQTIIDITEVGLKGKHMLILFMISLISIVPTFFNKKIEEKEKQKKKNN